MAHTGEHTVAIVNNEPAIVEVVRYNLVQDGYLVRTYSNTADALELISAPADVALLDRTNDPFDGVELYRRLRKAPARMPIIFLSAWTRELPAELRRKQLPAADGYIACPFSLDELRTTIRMVLAQ